MILVLWPARLLEGRAWALAVRAEPGSGGIAAAAAAAENEAAAAAAAGKTAAAATAAERARRRQRQIDSEVDMWLEAQRQRAYKAATDELERQMRQRREGRS